MRSRVRPGQHRRGAVHAAQGLSAALALWLALGATPALALPDGEALRAELQTLLPQARLVGSGRLTIWGFQVYDAQLWARPGFKTDNFSTQALALELSYLRSFANTEVADRSISEMRRAAPISDALAERWKAAMLRALPDVKKGDRVTGLHRPGVGASFWLNGQSTGEVRDAEFARLFFGIWLGPQSSEPQLRSALLAGAGS